MKEDKRVNNGGKRSGAGRPKQTEVLPTSVSFRIKEEWREPIKLVVRKEIKKLKNEI